MNVLLMCPFIDLFVLSSYNYPWMIFRIERAYPQVHFITGPETLAQQRAGG